MLQPGFGDREENAAHLTSAVTDFGRRGRFLWIPLSQRLNWRSVGSPVGLRRGPAYMGAYKRRLRGALV